MKQYLIPLLTALASVASAQSQLLTTNWAGGFVNGGVVPDHDLSGLTITEMLTGLSGAVSEVSVTLNLTGGWNGDIYAYLYHDGVMSVLLNRVGTPANDGLGYGDSGFNVTLSDSAAFSIHNYQADTPTITGGGVQGTWQPDGAGLNQLNGLDASGAWSLYLVDESAGGVMTLNSWGLAIQAVPEPSTLALAAMGGLGMLWHFRRRKKFAAVFRPLAVSRRPSRRVDI
jgi:subtilisin-like proprotein convertase family protein